MGVILGLLLAFSVYQGVLNAKQGDALCTFRADLHKRIVQTTDYLKKHPEPLILGVSRATFLKSVADQTRTYHALNGLGC